MAVIFHGMLHHEIEDYVDDILGKAKMRSNHPIVLHHIL